MRWAALLVCAGCNSWFGLDETHIAVDASPDAELFDQASVVYQVATTDATGLPLPPIYAGIPSANISIGPINGALVQTPADANGVLQVPQTLAAAPWRLVYQIGAATPVEYQWQVTAPVVCVPRFGRLDRTPVTANDYVRMSPQPMTFMTSPRLMTSGVWTETKVPASSTGVYYAFQNATALDGALGEIGQPGEWEMVLDYANDGNGMQATGYAFAPAALVPMGTMGATPDYFSTPGTSFVDTYSSLSASAEFMTALGPSGLYRGNSTAHAAAGFIPSGLMPPVVTRAGLAETPILLDLQTVDATDLPASMSPINPVDVLVPRAVHVRRTDIRTVSGVTVESAIERFDLGTSAQYPTNAATTVAAGMAATVTLDGVDLNTADGASISAGTAVHALAFTVVEGVADDVVVTLSSFQGTMLVPVRRYITTGRSITIDAAQLVAGTTYMIDLEVRVGYPGAATGDYRTVAYPMSDTQMFAASFLVK